MRLRTIVLLLLLTAVAVFLVVTLPARSAAPTPFTPSSPWPVVRGAYHVHSQRSDGTGTVAEIAAAAARAGLQFIVLTDHGDGTRAPDPPTYRSGVLCIDAVEVSTSGGHLAALGLPQMPYRLAGEPRDVIEDVRRVGGIAIAAHPGSPKPALEWRDWEAPFDGLEWLNADSEWRDELWASLARTLLTYPLRPAETLASLLDRPEGIITRWDRESRRRNVFAIAGADAHARLGFRSGSEPYTDRVIARVPSYESSFRTFVNHVMLNAPLNGDAVRDAHEVLDGIRRGRMATSIEGIARLGGIDITAVGSGRVARIGEYIDSPSGVQFRVRVGAPDDTTLVLLHEGKPMYEAVGNEFTILVDATPGVYRIEARVPGAEIPWLFTNPIYVNLAAAHRALPRERALATTDRVHIPTDDWQAESSPDSESVLSRDTLQDGTPVVAWRLQIAASESGSPYAAVSFPLGERLAASRGIQLRARADRPMRIWAQLRTRGDRGGRRWARSFYLDDTMRPIELAFDAFRPMLAPGEQDSERPPMADVDSLLLVADTVHTLPGTPATISFSDLWLTK